MVNEFSLLLPQFKRCNLLLTRIITDVFKRILSNIKKLRCRNVDVGKLNVIVEIFGDMSE